MSHRRIVRERDRHRITGITKPTWARWDRDGKSGLPRKIQLGPKQVGWVEDELYEFNEQLIAERDKQLESAAG